MYEGGVTGVQGIQGGGESFGELLADWNSDWSSDQGSENKDHVLINLSAIIRILSVQADCSNLIEDAAQQMKIFAVQA